MPTAGDIGTTGTAGGQLERGAGVAIWRQIAAQLAAELAGRARPGARLATEAALAARFGVHRHTIRRAVADLAGRGLLRVEQGRGTFVQDVVVDYPLRRRVSFSAALLAQGREPGHEILSAAVIEADAVVAARLGLVPGAPVVQSLGRGSADGVPLSHGQSHFPAERFPDLVERLLAMPSITTVLASYGLTDYRRQSTRILTRLPSAQEAAWLKQPPSAPVLVTEAVDTAADGRPIRFGVTCFAGARIQLTVEPEPPA